MKNDRRNFFKTVGVAAAAAALAAPKAAQAAVATEKYLPSFRHAVSINGAAYEDVLTFDGGGMRADIVENDLGPDNIKKKHVASIFWEDITVAIGPNPASFFYPWIQGMLTRKTPTRTTTVAAVDAQGTIRNQLQYSNARITEVEFPALDSFRRDPAEVVVTFTGEQVRSQVPTGMVKAGPKQKPWMGSNFRLTIDGLDESTSRVTKIDSFVVKQPVVLDQVGIFREPTRNAIPVQVPDLVFYCPEEFAGPFLAYAKGWFIDGHHLEADEKSGRLEFLAPDRKTVYFTLSFSNLGLRAFSLEGDQMKASPNRRYKVEMYCEAATLTIGAIETT